jgi:peptidoglycan/LPS O-acetylase OafA/YrhL
MKKAIYILSALLYIFAFFLIVLFGASGHSISLKDAENVVYLILIGLYSLTGTLLIIFQRKGRPALRNVLILLLSFILLSFIYFFYETLQVKIGDYAIVIPIFIVLAISGLSIKILSDLLRKPGSGNNSGN